jgi:hypothetical protein
MSKTPNDIRMDPSRFPEWKTNADRIEIYGTDGVMFLGRQGGGWQVLGSGSEIIAQDYGYFPDEVHQQDFIKCIRTRKVPNSDIEQGHKSATLVHLANLSYRTGKKQLYYDPENEIVKNSDEANLISEGTYRKEYQIPEVV